MTAPILKKLQWRYACKKFDPSKTLSQTKLKILKEAFNLTATSYGLQPLKMVVVSDPQLKQQLVPLSMNQQQVVDASHVLVLCIETSLTETYIKEHFKREESIRNTPRSILEPFEKFLIEDFGKKSSEEINQWMINQAYLALGNLLTICALEEIDACPMEGFLPNAYDELLGLSRQGLASVLVLPVGHRAQDDFHATLKKVRRGVEEVIVEM